MENARQAALFFTTKVRALMTSIASTRIRYGWLIILSMALHRVPFLILPPPSLVEVKRLLMILSYALLIYALCRNHHLWSMRVMTLGATLNFAAIVANGGLMPVSPEARLQAGMTPLGQSEFGNVLPEGTGVLLPADETNLRFLSDIVPVSTVGAVFSVGDVVLILGLLTFVVDVACGTRTQWLKGQARSTSVPTLPTAS